jgi:hypothetical protein
MELFVLERSGTRSSVLFDFSEQKLLVGMNPEKENRANASVNPISFFKRECMPLTFRTSFIAG